ncbi:hypothetical protein GCM10027447_12420 [Glycomyces halotolerans]
MPVKYTWNGDKVKRKMREGRDRGLEMGAEHLLAESNILVPHREGILQDTGKVTVDKPRGKAAVSYNTVYAPRQHEELTWKHKPGKSAKFLEIPFHRDADVIRAIIAAQIRRRLR